MSGKGFWFQLFTLQGRETSSLLDIAAGNNILLFLVLAKRPANLGHKAKTSSSFSRFFVLFNHLHAKKECREGFFFHQLRFCGKNLLVSVVIGPFVINLSVQALGRESSRSRTRGGTSGQAVQGLGKSWPLLPSVVVALTNLLA